MPWIVQHGSNLEISRSNPTHESVVQQFGASFLSLSRTPVLLHDLAAEVGNEASMLLYPTKYAKKLMGETSALQKALSSRSDIYSSNSSNRAELLSRMQKSLQEKTSIASTNHDGLQTRLDLAQIVDGKKPLQGIFQDRTFPDSTPNRIHLYEKAKSESVESQASTRYVALLDLVATGKWKDTPQLKEAFLGQSLLDMQRTVAKMQSAYGAYDGAGDVFNDLLNQYNAGNPNNAKRLNEDPSEGIIRTTDALWAKDLLTMMSTNAQDTRRIVGILHDMYGKQLAAEQNFGDSTNNTVRLKALAERLSHFSRAKASLFNMPFQV